MMSQGRVRYELTKLVHHKQRRQVYAARRLSSEIAIPASHFLVEVSSDFCLDTVRNNDYPDWPDNPGPENVIVKKIIFEELDDVESPQWRELRKELAEIMQLRSNHVVVTYYATLIPKTDLNLASCNIFMEHCIGGDLETHLKSLFEGRKPIPLSYYGAQILTGLDYIHKRKLMHGDIKAANIFICATNGCTILKIGDFGTVTKLEAEATSTQDIVDVKGTARFCCPEMMSHFQDQDEHQKTGRLTDIWSFGCVLLQMIGSDVGCPRFVLTEGDGTKQYYNPDSYSRSKSTQSRRAFAVLWKFIKEGGGPEIEHSPNVRIIKVRESYFAVPVESNDGQGVKAPARTSLLQNPVSSVQLVDGWKEFSELIESCLRRSWDHMSWTESESLPMERDLGNYLRPTAGRLLCGEVFGLGGRRTDDIQCRIVLGVDEVPL